MGSQQAMEAFKVYRVLLKAVKKHIGKEEYKKHFSQYIAEQFRKNSQLSDPSLVAQRIKLANDYTYLLNSVHHHKVIAMFHSFDFRFTYLLLSARFIQPLIVDVSNIMHFLSNKR